MLDAVGDCSAVIVADLLLSLLMRGNLVLDIFFLVVDSFWVLHMAFLGNGGGVWVCVDSLCFYFG